MTPIRKLSIEIYSDVDRGIEACVLAGSINKLQLWNDRLWLAFQEVSDYLNAPHVPLIVFPLVTPRPAGKIQRANFWLTPHSLPPSPYAAILVDTKIFEDYMPDMMMFKGMEAFRKLGDPDVLINWEMEYGLRIVGAYSDEPEEDDEVEEGIILPGAEIADEEELEDVE